MKCPHCSSTLVYEKSIHNKSKWAGDIYSCYKCEKYFIDDVLEGLLPYNIIDNRVK
jgi:transposase-like protein